MRQREQAHLALELPHRWFDTRLFSFLFSSLTDHHVAPPSLVKKIEAADRDNAIEPPSTARSENTAKSKKGSAGKPASPTPTATHFLAPLGLKAFMEIITCKRINAETLASEDVEAEAFHTLKGDDQRSSHLPFLYL